MDMITIKNKTYSVLIYEEKDREYLPSRTRGTCVDVRCFPIKWLYDKDFSQEFLGFMAAYSSLYREGCDDFYFYGDLDKCIGRFKPTIIKLTEPKELENFDKEAWLNYIKNTHFKIEVAPSDKDRIVFRRD